MLLHQSQLHAGAPANIQSSRSQRKLLGNKVPGKHLTYSEQNQCTSPAGKPRKRILLEGGFIQLPLTLHSPLLTSEAHAPLTHFISFPRLQLLFIMCLLPLWHKQKSSKSNNKNPQAVFGEALSSTAYKHPLKLQDV